MNYESIFNETIHKSIPEHLYHYTSSKGLLGIIQDEKFWATKTQYLNDSSELRLAFELIHKEIENQLVQGPTVRGRDELLQLKERLANINSNYDGNDTGGTNLAVASLSEQPDLLSLWRGYCKVGDGYSLGFYGSKLHEEIAKKGYLLPCIYKENDQKRLVSELVNYCSLQDPSNDVDTNELPPLNQISFEKAVLLISPIIKDYGFHEEKEWRLVFKGKKDETKFRSGNSSIIPYWEIRFNLHETLYQIVIGPTSLKEQSKNAVRTLLRIKPNFIIHKKDGVINSKIPFGNI